MSIMHCLCDPRQNAKLQNSHDLCEFMVADGNFHIYLHSEALTAVNRGSNSGDGKQSRLVTGDMGVFLGPACCRKPPAGRPACPAAEATVGVRPEELRGRRVEWHRHQTSAGPVG